MRNMNRPISDLVRGFGAMLETGKWIIWSGDGTWRGVTPPMEEWREANGANALRAACSLKWCPLDNHIRYCDAPWEDDYVVFTQPEQAYLYEILERVYLIPERARWKAAQIREEEERKKGRLDAIREIEAAGRAAKETL